MTDYWY